MSLEIKVRRNLLVYGIQTWSAIGQVLLIKIQSGWQFTNLSADELELVETTD